jgi:hypothetical protein
MFWTKRARRAHSAARRDGGWRNRCELCRQACKRPMRSSCCAAAKTIAAVAREADASAVYWNDIAQAPHRAAADRAKAALAAIGVGAQDFAGDLLVAPENIRNKENRGLRVFTPFWRRVQSLGDPPSPLPAPTKFLAAPELASDALESWQLEPTRPDWAGGLRENWKPGEAAAQKRLKSFLENAADYASERDRPRPRWHIKTLAASALRRDQPAANLARGALCGGRASSPRRRHRQIPQRIGLA